MTKPLPDINKITIKDYVEAAYLHGLCVENFDTGELDPPRDISEVQWITDRITQLLLEARALEIERLLDEHQFFAPTHKQLTDRVAELKALMKEK